MTARTGRPPGSTTLLTAEVTKGICDQLEIAVPDKWAAAMYGISEELYYRWLRLGEAGQRPYDAFFSAVARARAKCISNMHVRALKGDKGSNAAMWMLERRHWRDYAEHKRVEVTPPEPPMSEADLDEEIAAQRKRVADYERARALLTRSGEIPGED